MPVDGKEKQLGPVRLALLGLGLALALAGTPDRALAHDGHAHAKPAAKSGGKPGAVAPAAAAGRIEEALFGGRVGGNFDLVDQNGQRRQLADFAGRHVLLFFGYANCEAICSAAMPAMATAVDKLGPGHPAVDLVMITVDPERDTQEGLRSGLANYDPRFIGLTGPRDRLEAAWKAFSIEVKEVARDWNDKAILSHGSFVYLLGRDGKVQTLLPPILSPDEMARIIKTYF